MLEAVAQDDPDAYSYSGALFLGSARWPSIRRDVQGAAEGAEPDPDGDPGGNFKGTEALPADGRSTASSWRTATSPSG